MKLFSNRKNKNSEIENREIQACKAPKPNTDIIHARSICSGLLYSTKDSEQVVSWLDTYSDGFALFRTKNGRWFRCQKHINAYRRYNLDYEEYVYDKDVIYSNIIPVNEDYAKRTVGEYDVQKYLDLWGDEVEEA